MENHFNNDTALLELIKVTKIYPPDIVALQDISFSAHRGEMIFLTGTSGAGKTTLLKLICRQGRPSRGLIEIGGNDLNRLNSGAIQQLRQKIGVAYQDFRLLPNKTVFRNIAMAMEVCYTGSREIQQRVNSLLQQLDINNKKDKPVNTLSRGEQQKVAIARAAANTPPLVLADEPTGNLDSESTSLVMNFFRSLNENGSTTIIASHDENIYKNSKHRVLTLRNGKLYQNQ
ncbi:MAG: cell division ATP-binding protein FtsE [Thermodesulfobacteriota bacterium]